MRAFSDFKSRSATGSGSGKTITVITVRWSFRLPVLFPLFMVPFLGNVINRIAWCLIVWIISKTTEQHHQNIQGLFGPQRVSASGARQKCFKFDRGTIFRHIYNNGFQCTKATFYLFSKLLDMNFIGIKEKIILSKIKKLQEINNKRWNMA